MINNIQNTFSIQDLEILSGIKAHTIRIWEKRFAILNPTRLNRNIRVYSLLDLQKILNLSLLQKHNFKISELAKFADGELETKAKDISLENFPSNYYINSLIVSMFTLNEELFEEVYSAQSLKLNFSEIFVQTYLPLLNHIGVLWQTNGINPAQEHFISNLIYQKIALNIALIPKKSNESKHINVLFLPEGETHEIGLLYMLYHLKRKGEKTIYLGRDIPMDNLFSINSQFQEVNWICSFVIDRTDDEKLEFISQIDKLLLNTKNRFTVVGKMWDSYIDSKINYNLCFYKGFDQLIQN